MQLMQPHRGRGGPHVLQRLYRRPIALDKSLAASTRGRSPFLVTCSAVPSRFGLHRAALVSTETIWSPPRRLSLHREDLVSTERIWSPRREIGHHGEKLVSAERNWSPRREIGLRGEN